SRIGTSTLQGDRDSGGTNVDEKFRLRNSLVNDFFIPAFLEQVFPALKNLLLDEKNFNEFKSSFMRSPGWVDEKNEQFRTIFENLLNNKFIESIFVSIAFLEDYMRRTLDAVGVNIDTEKAANAEVIHANQFE